MYTCICALQGYGNIADVSDPATSGDVFLGTGVYATAISAGGDNSCALLSNQQMICWGNGKPTTITYIYTTMIV
jgi:Regulator of chromosome condensation (RCC1) repeat